IAIRGTLETDHPQDRAAVRGQRCEGLEIPAMLFVREVGRLRRRTKIVGGMELGIERDLVPPPADVLEAGVSSDLARVRGQRSVALESVCEETGEGPAESLLHEVALHVPVREAKAPHRRANCSGHRRHLARVATHERGGFVLRPILLIHGTRYTGESGDCDRARNFSLAATPHHQGGMCPRPARLRSRRENITKPWSRRDTRTA